MFNNGSQLVINVPSKNWSSKDGTIASYSEWMEQLPATVNG